MKMRPRSLFSSAAPRGLGSKALIQKACYKVIFKAISLFHQAKTPVCSLFFDKGIGRKPRQKNGAGFMKAIYFKEHGEIDVLRFGDIPEPTVDGPKALIRIKASALNHLDIWVRRGWKGLSLDMPHVTGSDAAGVVESLPAGIPTKLKVGDRVLINPGMNLVEDEWTRRGEHSVSPGYRILGEHVQGGLAEFLAVPIDSLLPIPDHVSDAQAAAGSLVATTCWRMLFKRCQMQAGQTVLVVGAGGGVNSMSILLARAAGAQVIALTSSEEKMKKAREIGAHQVVNYREFPKWFRTILEITDGRGVDIVVDNVGQASFLNSLRSLRNGGSLVTVGNTSGPEVSFDNRLIFTKQLSILGSTMGSRQDFVDANCFLWDQGIKTPIDSVAPLEEGIEMISRMEKGEQFGKLVLQAG